MQNGAGKPKRLEGCSNHPTFAIKNGQQRRLWPQYKRLNPIEMATKTKVNNMSEEDEKKMAQWIQESKGRRLLSDEKMAERYSVALSMFGDGQEELPSKEHPKEDEVSVAVDSSVVTSASTATKVAFTESIQKDYEEITTREEPVAGVVAEPSTQTPPSESPDSPSMQEESVSLLDGNDGKQPPVHRVSSKQRRLSFEEYRSVYLPVPKIENRMPVFISASLRDELDKIARRLGGKRMSASGIVENMVKHHLITYGDELKEWYKL